MVQTEIALFGNGCFWCSEAVFKELNGVISVMPGYAGGETSHPTYRDVCTGRTGHAEVLQVTFDPAIISYHQILQVFFLTHDPTQLNRQGNDVGTQYRSVIFALNATQKAAALQAIQGARAPDVWGPGVVTELKDAATFWPAEASHHDFYARNPENAYCNAVIPPKLQKARRHLQALMSSKSEK